MYTIRIHRQARKFLDKLPEAQGQKIIDAIARLSDYPELENVDFKKLSNTETYRIRIGNYCVIFEIDTHHKIIFVTIIGHRKNVYEKP